MPIVTVLMPVYNSAMYVGAAIESILAQSFRDFELLIFDDGSEDETIEIINNFKDSRISLMSNESNIGVACTLNKGLDLATGRYIARMDGDDICEPYRLQRQVDYLESHSELGLCGSWARYFSNKLNYIARYPVGTDCIKAFMLFGNPIAHPTVMIRSELFRKTGLKYNSDSPAAQDYELWSHCVEHFPIDNIPEPLVRYRVNEEGMTHVKFNRSNKQAMHIQRKELKKLGINVSDEELEFHRYIGNGSGMKDFKELKRAEKWFSRLVLINDSTHVYPEEGLRKATAFAWFRSCLNSSGMGIQVVKLYRRSAFRKYYTPGVKEAAYLYLNSILRIRREPTSGLLGEDRS